jgi:hypothetical protein
MASAMNQMRWNYLAATEKIEVGTEYFTVNRSAGLTLKVKVLSKSFDINQDGWPSSVEVEVLAQILTANEYLRKMCAVGSKHIVSATLLHKTPEGNPVKPFKRWY